MKHWHSRPINAAGLDVAENLNLTAKASATLGSLSNSLHFLHQISISPVLGMSIAAACYGFVFESLVMIPPSALVPVAFKTIAI